MKPIFIFIAVSLVICLGAWVGGVDFNERGEKMLFIYFFCVFVGGLAVCGYKATEK